MGAEDKGFITVFLHKGQACLFGQGTIDVCDIFPTGECELQRVMKQITRDDRALAA